MLPPEQGHGVCGSIVQQQRFDVHCGLQLDDSPCSTQRETLPYFEGHTHHHCHTLKFAVFLQGGAVPGREGFE